MIITPVKTKILKGKSRSLIKFIDKNIDHLSDKSVVAITSKVVAILEGRLIPINDSMNKDEIVKQEADYYLPKIEKYNLRLTIKDNVLIPSAGVDESNAFGNYILWPGNPYKSAREVRTYLAKKLKLKNVGVIITDSKTSPLRWGTTGVSIGHSGFHALNDYIGTADLFGRELKYTQANIVDGLAAAAVLVMGEGAEQTPLTICEDIENIKFSTGSPTKTERAHFNISLKEDLYYSILSKAGWKKKIT